LKASGRAQQRAKWALYRNEQFSFCIHYPSQWHQSVPFTKNGITLAPRPVKNYILKPTVTIGARINQSSETSDNQPQTLEDIFNSGIRALREYGGVGEVTVLGKEIIRLQGFNALATSIRYRDSDSGNEWFDKDVNLIDQNNVVYFMELKCHPDDAATLLATFDAMVKTLRLTCGRK
jgi:hypothetical protein